MQTAKLVRHGNSTGLTLGKDVLQAAGLELGDTVTFLLRTEACGSSSPTVTTPVRWKSAAPLRNATAVRCAILPSPPSVYSEHGVNPTYRVSLN